MNETEKAFREDLEILLKKYNATIEVVTNIETDMAIQVECNPSQDCTPYAIFEL